MTLSQVLSPAIRLAKHGFPVSPLTAAWWQDGLRTLSGPGAASLNPQQASAAAAPSAPAKRAKLLPKAAPRAGGDWFSNPDLAAVLESLARDGKAAFYSPSSPVARAIVEAVQEQGGHLALSDLEEHTST